jgi:hypothetical protein
MQMIGWACRKVYLVTGVFLIINLFFLVSFLLHLRGTPTSWAVRATVYMGFPIMCAVLFEQIRRRSAVPLRGDT